VTRHPRHQLPRQQAHQAGLRLSSWRRRALYGVGAGAWVTGILWLIFHYFLMRQGEFGSEPQPLETWWLRLHGAFAFAALWIGGMLWAVHIGPALSRPGKRISGLLLVGMLAILAVTGYLLYYAVDDGLRDGVRWAHWICGILIGVVLGIHVVRARAQRARLSVGQVKVDPDLPRASI
jgi:hypothetical protein